MSTPPPSSSPTTRSPAIPVLLLKTRSQPHDSYQEYFSTTLTTPPADGRLDHEVWSSSDVRSSADHFRPLFIPVLEHRPNRQNLDTLQHLLHTGGLAKKYGGMIFTSQRAVEAWTDVVKGEDRLDETTHDVDHISTMSPKVLSEDVVSWRTGMNKQVQSDGSTTQLGTINPVSPATSMALVDDDFSFPLYSVGPATSRALNTLVDTSRSAFSRLRPSVLGDHTGNGANLAQYILSHYNGLHHRRLYTFYDAPRLPFTPLIGPPRGERIDQNDERLKKKGLLFLVGEQRRDIIPKTLTDVEGKLASEQRIDVDEVEVYMTGIMDSFEDDFCGTVKSFKQEKTGIRVVVIVVFSPQGCEAMLRSLGYIDGEGHQTESARNRWHGSCNLETTELAYVVVTIGPTTRDHLKDQFGFDADVCARKPTPQGVGEGLLEFLHEKHLV